MQNLVLIREETRALDALCAGTTLVPSAERWSPVAAVRCHGVDLPDAVRPRRVDLDILLPDLFGFATDASVVVFDEPLVRADGGPVPFHAPLPADSVTQLAPFLPALRSPDRDVVDRPHLCLLPESGPPDHYRHLPLPDFVGRLLEYLSAPVEGSEADLAACRRAWELTGDPWWLRRLGHALDGLGRTADALEAHRTGQRLFPHLDDFRREVQRREAQWRGPA